MQVNPITPAERILRHRNEKDLLDGRTHLIQCAWCKKFQVAGKWVAEFTPLIGQIISHGICPDCKEKELEKAHA